MFYKHIPICKKKKRWLPWDLRVFEWLRSSLCSPLCVSNEARESLSWQPTQGVLVGRHPLMAADKWGASRDTGVRVGRMWGLSRWDLIWPLPLQTSPPPTMGQARNSPSQITHKWRWEVSGTSKVFLIAKASQGRSIWHLEFAWWPEMERLDFGCLTLNCTAGVQQTWEVRMNTNWGKSIDKQIKIKELDS